MPELITTKEEDANDGTANFGSAPNQQQDVSFDDSTDKSVEEDQDAQAENDEEVDNETSKFECEAVMQVMLRNFAHHV